MNLRGENFAGEFKQFVANYIEKGFAAPRARRNRALREKPGWPEPGQVK